MNKLSYITFVLLALSAISFAESLKDWKHSGSIFINTTEHGANLPADALEKDVPVLIRLNQDFFNFSNAQANGEDLRFSQKGAVLAHQIE